MGTTTKELRLYRPLYRAKHRVRVEAITTDGFWPRDEYGRRRTGNDPCKFHEDNGEGYALCGTKPKPWVGLDGIVYEQCYVEYGAGPVECARCANHA
jgi:hypothetical protein